jgi:hypothetical protein
MKPKKNPNELVTFFTGSQTKKTMTNSKMHYVGALFLLAQTVLPLSTAAVGTSVESESDTGTPTPTKLSDEDFLYGRGRDAWDLDLECRKYPLWLGILRSECEEHLDWKPLQPWWWEEYSSISLGEQKISEMNACMEQEFLEYMKSWPE